MSVIRYNFNYPTPCTWEVCVFSIAFSVSQRGAVHCIYWSEKTNNLSMCHHSFITSKGALPDPPRHSQLMMQHRVPSPMDQALLTQALLTHHTEREMGQHSTGEKDIFFLRYWWRTKIESDQQTCLAPEQNWGKKFTSSQISLLSCTNNLSLLGDKEAIW